MDAPPPRQQNTSGSSLSQRLGYYLVGVAIGLVALGFLWSNRQRAVQSQQGEAAGQTESAPATPGGTP